MTRFTVKGGLLMIIALLFSFTVNAIDPNALTVTESQDTDGTVEVEEDADKYEMFTATNEWKEVEPGQAIPPGLHVKINLQTGKKEAKLMDGEETTDIREPMKEETEKAVFTKSELKRALKNFKAMRVDTTTEEARREEVRKKFRSTEELKEALKEMDLNIKTDSQIVRELLANYKRPDIDQEEKLRVLTDLEYYLHQIDNAQDFAKMGGLIELQKDLNSTSEDVKSKAALALGASLQSNPKVQMSAVEDGTTQHLIRLLSIETSNKVSNRLLYALSSLLRQFPHAQIVFCKHGGMAVLKRLAEDKTEKIRVKAVTLVHDLLLEQHYAEKYSKHGDKNQHEKHNQYKKIPLSESIEEQGWCETISNLIATASEHDSREKLLNSMRALLTHCGTTFIKTTSSLVRLRSEYEVLSSTEQDDTYYADILTNIRALLREVYPPSAKEEL